MLWWYKNQCYNQTVLVWVSIQVNYFIIQLILYDIVVIHVKWVSIQVNNIIEVRYKITWIIKSIL
jgi:hypothetical protein